MARSAAKRSRTDFGIAGTVDLGEETLVAVVALGATEA